MPPASLLASQNLFTRPGPPHHPTAVAAEDFGDGEGPSSSELAAAELIAIGRQRGEGGPDYLHMPLEQLSGGAFAEELLLEEEALLLAGVTGGSAANSGGLGLEDDEEDEDEEAEEEEEHGGELGSSAAFGEEEEEEGGEGRHGHPRLPSHFVSAEVQDRLGWVGWCGTLKG